MRDGKIYPDGRFKILHPTNTQAPRSLALTYHQTTTKIIWITFEMYVFKLLLIYSFIGINNNKLYLYFRNNGMDIIKLNNGSYLLSDPKDTYEIFSGVEGKLYFLVISNSKSIDSMTLASKAFMTSIEPGTNSVEGPFMIYHSENSEIVSAVCDIRLSTGYYCTFLMKNEKAKNKQFMIKVSFLYSEG